jgi:hypothetical protein
MTSSTGDAKPDAHRIVAIDLILDPARLLAFVVDD